MARLYQLALKHSGLNSLGHNSFESAEKNRIADSQTKTKMKTIATLALFLLALSEMECTSDPCPRSWFQFEDYCYLVKESTVSWSSAQEYCLSQGGNLVKINNIGENEFVLQLVRQEAPSVKQVWIGLGFNTEADDWTWIDNSHPFFTNWSPGEPNGFEHEPCGEMYVDNTAELPVNGYWNDLTCNNISAIVCKKLADHSTYIS